MTMIGQLRSIVFALCLVCWVVNTVQAQFRCSWPPINRDVDPAVLASAFAEADHMFEEYRKGLDIPGVVYGVMYKGKLLHTAGFGRFNYSDPASPAPDSKTLFRIGSVTKVLTALNTMHDVYTKCLPSLDAPLQSVLKNFSIEMPFAQETPVTFRDLMGQTAGIPRATPCDFLDGKDCLKSVSEILERIREVGIGTMYTAGFRASYSNTAFALLGHASRYACGRNGSTSYADVFQENLLRPWNLTHTGFDLNNPAILAKLAVGLMQDPFTGQLSASKPYSLGFDAPSGEAYSTIEDLLTLTDKMMNGLSFEDQLTASDNGNNGDDGVLDLYWRKQFFRPSFVFNDNSSYGFPAELLQIADGSLRLYTKGGAVFGYESMIAMQPEMDFGFAVLANRDGAETFEITWTVTELLMNSLLRAISAAGPYPYAVPPAGSTTTIDSALGTFWVNSMGLSAKIFKVTDHSVNISIDLGFARVISGLSFVHNIPVRLPFYRNGSVIQADVYRLVNVYYPGFDIPCRAEMSGFPMSEIVFVPCLADPTRHCGLTLLTAPGLYGKMLERDDSKPQPPFPTPPAPNVVPSKSSSDHSDDSKEKSGLIAGLVVVSVLLAVSAVANIAFVWRTRKARNTAGSSAMNEALLR